MGLISKAVKTFKDNSKNVDAGVKTAPQDLNIKYTTVRRGTLGNDQFLHVGTCDVIRDFKWGISSSQQIAISEVPSIILTEFQPTSGPVAEALSYYVEQAGQIGTIVKAGAEAAYGFIASKVTGDKKGELNAREQFKQDAKGDAYAKMYTGKYTGNLYIFPYFSETNHGLTTSWGVADGMLKKVDAGLQDVRNVGSVVSNQYPADTKRQMFKSVENTGIQFDFYLFNTLADDPVRIIKNNYNLLRVLLHNNLPEKTSAVTLRPPVIYSIDIPGVRYSPAAYINNINVENVGQVNNLLLPLGNDGMLMDVNVPDAWHITISLVDLLPETRNIFGGVFDNAGRVVVLDGGGTRSSYGFINRTRRRRAGIYKRI